MSTLHEAALIFRGQHEVNERDHICPVAGSIHDQAFRISGGGVFKHFKSSYLKSFEGTCTELGIVNALSKSPQVTFAQRNPKTFDKIDEDSYVWDVGGIFVDGDHSEFEKYEVKKIKSLADLNYFNFNYHSDGHGLDLTTYIDKGTKATKYLVLAWLEDKSTSEYSYLVHPKYIFKSSKFKDYVKPTTYEDAQLSHYVNVNQMINDGYAVKIQ